MSDPIRDMAGLVEALRQRRDALDISHETIDEISGLQSGYAGKLLAPRAPRNLSYNSLGLILGALGVGLQVVEDHEQIRRVSNRWQKRKPQGPRYRANTPIFTVDSPSPSTSSLSISDRMRQIRKLVKKESLVKAGKNGGKRRAKAMAKRARQQQATHAARKRWASRLRDSENA